MTYIAGVDIGNSTTEVCIGEVGGAQVHFLSSASCKTTGTPDDIKISKEMLHAQGQVAKENCNDPKEKNFERAAELVDVPDDVILKMYDKLRPNRSTKLELVLMAQELLEKYNAKNCALLVMEAAEVYEKRGILL